jgi:hypothetical protein
MRLTVIHSARPLFATGTILIVGASAYAETKRIDCVLTGISGYPPTLVQSESRPISLLFDENARRLSGLPFGQVTVTEAYIIGETEDSFLSINRRTGEIRLLNPRGYDVAGAPTGEVLETGECRMDGAAAGK